MTSTILFSICRCKFQFMGALEGRWSNLKSDASAT
uniref:Uncharacterized protein n=1 Tax=Arundo donax TaxID=35708 RepID=A0A0A9ATF7_ARUDO